MTANEMKYRFNILYNKITKFDAPGYKDRELSELFSLSQNEIVKLIYNPLGNKYGKGFENSEKRRKDLDKLLRNIYLDQTNYASSQLAVHKNGIMYNLPPDLLWVVQEECYMKIYEEDCTEVEVETDPKTGFYDLDSIKNWSELKIVGVKPVTHDEYNKNIRNPFKKPYENLIWRLDFSYDDTLPNSQIQHELINYSGWDVLRYRIVYLRIPQKIVVDTTTSTNQVNCELIETMHVEMATGITAPEEYKIKAVEANKVE